MPDENKYNVEESLAETAKLHELIEKAHRALTASQQALVEARKQRHASEGARKKLSSLVDERSRLTHLLQERQQDHARIESELERLRQSKASLRWQVEATQMYLHELDLVIESSLRVEGEEDDHRRRVDGMHAGGGLPSSMDAQPWSSEEEVEYLQLESQQRNLAERMEVLRRDVLEKQATLDSMLQTLKDGEASVQSKRIRCAELETEASAWRDRIVAFLNRSTGSTASSTIITMDESAELHVAAEQQRADTETATKLDYDDGTPQRNRLLDDTIERTANNTLSFEPTLSVLSDATDE